jgi:hypothetical protein
MRWPSSREWNTGGSPIARMITPIICTIVASRKAQSSVSYADANHEKLIHAQQIPKVAKPKPMRPAE